MDGVWCFPFSPATQLSGGLAVRHAIGLILALCCALGFFGGGVAVPAEAATLFTIDADDDDLNDVDGSDDLPFSFLGSLGYVTGTIRAVDVTTIDKAALQASVDTYVDFAGGTPLDFFAMDILIVDVVLAVGSAPIDEIGVAVGTDPLGIDPAGAGFFLDCATDAEEGCTGLDRGGVAFPVNGQTPYLTTAIYLQPGNIFFPGAALFEFDKNGLSTDNLEAGEVSRRLLVAWDDLGPDAPLSGTLQLAEFMVSSGTNQDFFVEIVEAEYLEPAPSSSASEFPEARYSCGLGIELALLLPPLLWLSLRQRRSLH
jgi:hypothetical protein